MSRCILCQRELTPDETALHKKLINRASKEYMCITCLAKHFGVEEFMLHGKIDEFKNMGCTLFKS